MTKAELLRRVSSHELSEWIARDCLRAEAMTGAMASAALPTTPSAKTSPPRIPPTAETLATQLDRFWPPET